VNTYQATISHLEQERVQLVGRLDAIDMALASLQILAPAAEAAPVRAGKPRVVGKARSTVQKQPMKAEPVATLGVDGRAQAILHRLRMNGGVATAKELRQQIPAFRDMEAEAGSKALSNALYRLKAAGQINRTGHTWSLVGAASEAA
jgi:hypothetical protein